jgi:hypothetical protein
MLISLIKCVSDFQIPLGGGRLLAARLTNPDVQADIGFKES